MLGFIVPQAASPAVPIRLADPRWARNMATAMRWMVYYLGVAVVITILGTLVGFILELAKKTSAAKPDDLVQRYHQEIIAFSKLFDLGMGLVGLSMAAGLAFIAHRAIQKDPRAHAPDPLDRLRSMAPLLFYALAFTVLFDFIAQLYQTFNASEQDNMAFLVIALFFRMLSSLVVGAILYIMVRIFADTIRRTSGVGLAAQAFRVSYYCLAMAVLMVLICLVVVVTQLLVVALAIPEIAILGCFVCVLAPILFCAAIAFLIEGVICYLRAAVLIENEAGPII
jgi:hypothetical protein